MLGRGDLESRDLPASIATGVCFDCGEDGAILGLCRRSSELLNVEGFLGMGGPGFFVFLEDEGDSDDGKFDLLF